RRESSAGGAAPSGAAERRPSTPADVTEPGDRPGEPDAIHSAGPGSQDAIYPAGSRNPDAIHSAGSGGPGSVAEEGARPAVAPDSWRHGQDRTDHYRQALGLTPHQYAHREAPRRAVRLGLGNGSRSALWLQGRKGNGRSRRTFMGMPVTDAEGTPNRRS